MSQVIILQFKRVDFKSNVSQEYKNLWKKSRKRGPPISIRPTLSQFWWCKETSSNVWKTAQRLRANTAGDAARQRVSVRGGRENIYSAGGPCPMRAGGAGSPWTTSVISVKCWKCVHQGEVSCLEVCVSVKKIKNEENAYFRWNTFSVCFFLN